MTLSNHRENGDGERDGDGGEVQNVVGYANYTLQKLGKIVGWKWQKQEREGGIKAGNFLQINPLELL